MIEQAFGYFILTGTTIGTVLFYLWRRAVRTGHSSVALIRLNEELGFDTPDFLRQSWSVLSRAGLRGMEWQLDWFGVTISERHGRTDGNRVCRALAVGEMRLEISVYSRHMRGEGRYFDEAVTETLLLLLRADMWIKAGATDTTFTQMARLTLFLQHDMKNIAQFIQLMGDQLESVRAGREQQVLDYLCRAVPLIRKRADRIVQSLTRTATPGAECELHLRDEVAQLCQLYRLECRIAGDCVLPSTSRDLVSALDNIFKNYRDHTSAPSLQLEMVEQENHVALSVTSTQPWPAADLERLFEPFWSSDPNGLGIGLYQSKQLLERAGGSLAVERSGEGILVFRLCFPVAQSASRSANAQFATGAADQAQERYVADSKQPTGFP